MQPQGAARINAAHPSASGLVFAMPHPAVGDIVSGNKLTIGTGGRVVANAQGLAISGTGSAARASIPLNLSSSNKMSMAMWLYWPAYANDDLFAMELTANTNSNDGAFLLNPNSSGGYFQTYTRITSSTDGKATNFVRPSAGLHHHVLTADRTISGWTNGWRHWVDGIEISPSVQLGASGTSSFATSTLYLLSRAGTSLYSIGQISGLTFWNRLLSDAEAPRIYKDGGGWSLFASRPQIYVQLGAPAAGATDYPLDAAPGTYAVNGTAATLARGLPLNAATGTYAVNGTAATLARGRSITAATGTYAVNGTAATLLSAKAVNAATGTYAVNGTAATLDYLQAGSLNAATGTYAVTGTDATLTYAPVVALSINAAPGTFAISGVAGTLTYVGSSIWTDVGAASTSWSDVSPSTSIWTDL